MRLPNLPAYANQLACVCAIALGFAIPISSALDNVLLAVIALSWALAGGFADKWRDIHAKPVVFAALALFAMLAIGLSYGERNPGDGLAYLLKYDDLLFIPVFLTLFGEERSRELALKAFCGALIVDIIVSWLAYADLLVFNPVLHSVPEFPTGFKSTITHSLFVCFMAFLCALAAWREKRRAIRIAYIGLALLAAHNVFFIAVSRTGYLVLALLIVYFFVATFGRRGVVILGVVAIASASVVSFTSNTLHERIRQAATELSTWHAGTPLRLNESSVGTRMEFYRGTLKIISEHPLLGAGTGSFPLAYSKATSGQDLMASANPHDEYLLITSQIGLVGLACMLFLFCQQWRWAGRLADPLYRDLGRGLVIIFAAGCLFNSLLLDHAEGLFFAWMTGLIFASPRQVPAVAQEATP